MAMYRTPQAAAEILNAAGSPEQTEIANRIMTEGLPQALANMTGQPIPGAGPQMAQQMPPSPSNDPVRRAFESGEAKESSPETQRGDWLLRNIDDPVPWNPELTWGEYLNRLEENSGRDAVNAVIDEELKTEVEDKRPEDTQRIPPPPPVGQSPMGQQVMAPVDQQGIIAAANGGLVSRLATFAQGGLNEAPMAPAEGSGVVDPNQFMEIISGLTEESGIPQDQIDAVADVATETTGGPDAVLDTGIMQNVEAQEATANDLSGIGGLVNLNTQLQEAGEEPLVHVTPGEMVVPLEALQEKDKQMLFSALESAGVDPLRYIVGNDNNVVNELTGLPAFFFKSVGRFFGKVGKTIGKVAKKVGSAIGSAAKKVGGFLKKNAGTILGIAGAMTGNPWLAALGSGIGSLIEGKPISSALLSAGMSFAGTKWVGPWIGEKISSVAPNIGLPEMNLPTGDFLAQRGTGAIGRATAEGVAHNLATQNATAAAADAALTGMQRLGEQGTIELAQNAALASLKNAAMQGGTYIPQATAEAMSKTIGSQVAQQAISGGIKSAAEATVPSYLGSALSSAAGGAAGSGFISQALATTPAQIAGGMASSYLQKAATPYVQATYDSMTGGGVPAADEQAVIDAFNRQYNFVPTADQLYQFYTTEYVPNQQVNIQTALGGTPGYSNTNIPAGLNITGGSIPGGGIIAAAGGGYINGVGGPKSDSNLARLSDGEFVMTEQAVRGAGEGNRMAGARRMYDLMEALEGRAA